MVAVFGRRIKAARPMRLRLRDNAKGSVYAVLSRTAEGRFSSLKIKGLYLQCL